MAQGVGGCGGAGEVRSCNAGTSSGCERRDCVTGDGECEEHGGNALEAVEHESGDAEKLSSGASHVCRANVAGARSADILMADDADKEVAERDGAQKVCQGAGGEPRGHRR